jgi:hypothetical protein
MEVAMLGFQCGEFSRPVYFGLRTLKRDILGGVTGRDALSVAIRAADYVYRQPCGPELLRAFHDELMRTAPSEMMPLFTVSQKPATPSIEEPRHEQVVHVAGR